MILSLMIILILLPFAGGLLLQLLRFQDKRYKQCFIFGYVMLNTLLTYTLIAHGTTEDIELINFEVAKLNLSLKL